MGRSPCCAKEGLNRGAWTAIEDKILADYIKVHGEGRWRTLPKKAGLKRCGKSCRLRWLNYLRPDIKRGNITRDEEELIIRLHKLLGNRWSLIAGRLPGRTDNEIKNYWNTNLGKKIQENRSSPPNPKISSKQSNESLNRRTPSKTERQLVRTKAVRCTKAVLSSLTQKVEQVQCAPTNIEPAKQEEELFDSGFPHLLTSEDLIMDDFCMGDLSLSDLLNSDLSDLCDFSCSNDNSGDLSPHSEKEQQLILSGRVMEDWDLSDTGKNNVASDLHSFSSLLESEGDWL